jgi:integrase
MRISKEQQFQPQYIKLNDLNKILEMTTSEEIKKIFVFAFYTGCRLGEILQIRWKNINLDRRIVIIGGENFTTKNKKVREIPIHLEILKIIEVKGSRNSNQLLFSKQSGYFYNRDYISRQFKLVRRKAGLGEGIHFHSLRHSSASNLAISGVPIITIKELLGHSSIISTQIYSHSDLDSKRSAIEKL